MSILNNLSTLQNRRDEVPNQLLAKKIVEKNDKKAINELVENLQNKNKGIQGDCIKVLYEIGAVKPVLIAEYAADLIAALDSKNNRMQWGAMIAIDYITLEKPEWVYKSLNKLAQITDKGSVITRDHYVNILIQLCTIKKYAGKIFSLLNEQLLTCPTNQLAMYAERSLPAINETNKKTFLRTISSRLDEIDSVPKRKRIEKVIKKLS
jgi:hypothetical protein